MKTKLIVAALLANTNAIRFISDDEGEFYNNNAMAVFWANRELNQANKAGAPRQDYEEAWEKS
jgi:hypothetical protein